MIKKETKADRLKRDVKTHKIVAESAERAGREGNKAFFEKLGVSMAEPKGIGQFETIDHFMSATSAQRNSAIRQERATVRKKPSSFVVLVPRKGYSIDVYGPYSSFKKAEGDAQAWEGSVHPVDPITQGHL